MAPGTAEPVSLPGKVYITGYVSQRPQIHMKHKNQPVGAQTHLVTSVRPWMLRLHADTAGLH